MTARARRRHFFVVLAGALFVAACAASSTPTSATPNGGAPPAAISAAARTHLTELVNVMQNSIKRLTLDWSDLRARVEDRAAGAQAIADLYPAIRLALTLIGDGHSSYRSADGATTLFVGNRTCVPSGRAMPPLPSTIGYVSVGAFRGSGGRGDQLRQRHPGDDHERRS